MSKSETCLVESYNGSIRNTLARFKRKQGWKMICLYNHFSLRPTAVCHNEVKEKQEQVIEV